ncbi:MAG: hypothetical protein ACPG8W_01675 [Candidatus Promineifilaceae bacterium]
MTRPIPYYTQQVPYNPQPRSSRLRILLAVLLIFILLGILITILGNVATPNSAFAQFTPHATSFVAYSVQPTIDAQATVQSAQISAEVAAIANAQVAQANAFTAQSNAERAVAVAAANATVTAIADAARVQLELSNLEIAKAQAIARNDVAEAVATSAIETRLWLAVQIVLAIMFISGTAYTAAVYLGYLEVARAHAQRTANNVLALPAPRPAITTQRTTQPLSKKKKSKKKPKRNTQRRPTARATPRHRMTHDAPPLQAEICEAVPNRPEPVREPVRPPRTSSTELPNRSEPGEADLHPSGVGREIALQMLDAIAEGYTSQSSIARYVGGTAATRKRQARLVIDWERQQRISAILAKNAKVQA